MCGTILQKKEVIKLYVHQALEHAFVINFVPFSL